MPFLHRLYRDPLDIAIVFAEQHNKGSAAIFIAMSAGSRLTEPQKHVLFALLTIMTSCATTLVMLLGAHLRLG